MPNLVSRRNSNFVAGRLSCVYGGGGIDTICEASVGLTPCNTRITEWRPIWFCRAISDLVNVHLISGIDRAPENDCTKFHACAIAVGVARCVRGVPIVERLLYARLEGWRKIRSRNTYYRTDRPRITGWQNIRSDARGHGQYIQCGSAENDADAEAGYNVSQPEARHRQLPPFFREFDLARPRNWSSLTPSLRKE